MEKKRKKNMKKTAIKKVKTVKTEERKFPKSLNKMKDSTLYAISPDVLK